MRAFVGVVEAGSFVRAAEALGMSTAAMSRHVGEREARLGVRLLQRTTRRLSLTDEGQRFVERCREALATVEEAEAEVTAASGEARGLLRVNAPLTFGVLHLAPLWGKFLERNPLLRLEVTLLDRIVDLVEEGYDAAVRIAALPSSTLVSRRLASTRMVACAAPAYLARHGAPSHPGELAQHATFSYAYLSTGDEWRFTRGEESFAARIRPRLHANNGDTCRAAALSGQGIVLQPDFLVGGDLRDGRLVEVMPGWRSVELGIYAVYPSRKHLPAKVRRLVDFLVDAFAAPEWNG